MYTAVRLILVILVVEVYSSKLAQSCLPVLNSVISIALCVLDWLTKCFGHCTKRK